MARLHTNFDKSPYWLMVIFFYLMNCGIALQMVTSILGNCKTIFSERHETQVERDNFKLILDSFNQGVIIVGARQPKPDKNGKIPEPPKEPVMDEVLFMNKEIRRVIGDTA
jgi:hypothetical protein